MATYDNYTSVFRVRLGDDDGDTADLAASGSRRHRSRPVISCHLCRARKQGCDRKLPCSRCVRRGYGAQCHYGMGNDAGIEKGAKNTPPETPAARTAGNSSAEGDGEPQAFHSMGPSLPAMSALALTPGSDSGAATSMREATQALARPFGALPRQTAQKAQLRLQRLEAMVNALLSRTSPALAPALEGEDTVGVTGTEEIPGANDAGKNPQATTEASVAAAAHRDNTPRALDRGPPQPRSRPWPAKSPARPCTGGGVVTQMIGAMPTPAGTTWASVLDGIRDIQSYLAELGADEQQDNARHTNQERGGELHGDNGSAICDRTETSFDRPASSKLPGILTIAEPESIFASTVQVVESNNATAATTSALAGAAAASTPLSLASSYSASPSFSRPPPLMPSLVASAVAALPSRGDCDRLLAVYFQSTFHIGPYVHVRQFQRAYARFWQTGNPAVATAGPPLLWLSMLASMLTAGAAYVGNMELSTPDSAQSCASFESPCEHPTGLGGQGTNAGSVSSRNDASDLAASLRQLSTRCLVAGDYLGGHPMAVQALLLHIEVSIQGQRDVDPTMWATFGVVTRLAQRLGFQQVDAVRPAGSQQKQHPTPFYREIRRRLWYSIEAFDLQYSFLFGIPAIIRSDETATNPPTNLKDDDFDEDTTVLPPGRPHTEYTPVLYYIFKLKLIRMLRRILEFAVWKLPSATAATNGSETTSRAAAAAALASEIHASHKSLPALMRMPARIRDCPFDDDSTAIVHRFIIELLHHKGICVLFRDALGAKGANGHLATEDERRQHEAQRQACLVSALRILDLHRDLYSETWRNVHLDDEGPLAGLSVEAGAAAAGRDVNNNGGSVGRMATNRTFICSLSMNDFLMAATILCLDLIEGGRSPPASAPSSAGQNPMTTPISRSSEANSASANSPDSASANPPYPTPLSSSLPSSNTPLYFLGGADPSLLERAANRHVKLAAVRAEYRMWNERRCRSKESSHAARILGAIVEKLMAEEKAGWYKAVGNQTGTPPSPENWTVVAAPAPQPTAATASTAATVGQTAWADTSRQPDMATTDGLQSALAGNTMWDTAATGPVPTMDTAAAMPALYGPSQNEPVPSFSAFDPIEANPFDAVSSNPMNVDWNVIDSFLTSGGHMDVDAGSYLWSPDLTFPG